MTFLGDIDPDPPRGERKIGPRLRRLAADQLKELIAAIVVLGAVAYLGLEHNTHGLPPITIAALVVSGGVVAFAAIVFAISGLQALSRRMGRGEPSLSDTYRQGAIRAREDLDHIARLGPNSLYYIRSRFGRYRRWICSAAPGKVWLVILEIDGPSCVVRLVAGPPDSRVTVGKEFPSDEIRAYLGGDRRKLEDVELLLCGGLHLMVAISEEDLPDEAGNRLQVAALCLKALVEAASLPRYSPLAQGANSRDVA
jgi:hypothetical protein